MATKDWRMTSNMFFYTKYSNHKTGSKLTVGVNSLGDLVLEVNGKTIKKFKTKQQALAFAKSYMKTH